MTSNQNFRCSYLLSYSLMLVLPSLSLSLNNGFLKILVFALILFCCVDLVLKFRIFSLPHLPLSLFIDWLMLKIPTFPPTFFPLFLKKRKKKKNFVFLFYLEFSILFCFWLLFPSRHVVRVKNFKNILHPWQQETFRLFLKQAHVSKVLWIDSRISPEPYWRI